MLEPFKKLSFTETTVPEQFMHFCKEALTSKERGEMPNVHHDLFWVCKRHIFGILWKKNTANVDPKSLQQGIFSGLEHVCNFNGFQLFVFDVQFGKVYYTLG